MRRNPRRIPYQVEQEDCVSELWKRDVMKPELLVFVLTSANYIIGFLIGRWVTLRKLEEAVETIKKEMRDELQKSHMREL